MFFRVSRHLMKRAIHLRMFFVLWALSWSCLCLGQTAKSSESAANSQERQRPGVVLDRFDNDSSGAKKAGILPGDVLLRWSRGSAGGELNSPFEMEMVDVHEGSRGLMTFAGLRGTEKMIWTMPKIYWGAQVRPNFPDEFVALHAEARALADAGKFTEASEHWQGAAAKAEHVLPAWVSTWFLRQAAEALAQGQLWKESDEAYQKAVLSSARSGPAEEAQIRYLWGASYWQRNLWKPAEEQLLAALSQSRQTALTFYTAIIYDMLGTVARNQGNLNQAEEYTRQALNINAQEDPHSILTATNQLNLSTIVYKRGDFLQAEDFLLKALAVYGKASPRSMGTAFILNDLGEIARVRGDLKKAEVYFRQTLASLQRIDPSLREVATLFTNLADVLDQTGESKQAGIYLQQALELVQKLFPDGSPEEADIRDGQGTQAQRHGDLAAARGFYLQALALREKIAPQDPLAADTLNNLGGVNVALGDLKAADMYYVRALAIREKLMPGSVYYAETLAGLATLARRNHQPKEAAQYYDRALAALESQTARLGGSSDVRAGFRATHESYYRDYIDLLMGQNQTVRAFEVLERSRARTLLETLAAAHIDLHRGVDSALLQRERHLAADIKAKAERRISLLGEKNESAQVAAVEKEISALVSDYNEVEGQIRATGPAYAALTQPQPLNADAIRKELADANTLLLEYSLGETRSYLFVATPETLRAFTLPGRAEIEKQSRLVLELITERNRIIKGEPDSKREDRWRKAELEYSVASRALSQTILGPVAAQLSAQRKDQRLVIVADGALHYVPFGALPEPGGTPTQPFVVRHEIVNLPSASTLALLRQQYKDRMPAPLEVAIFADPVFDKDDSRITVATAASPQQAVPIKSASAGTPSSPPAEITAQTIAAVTAEASSSTLLTRSAEAFDLERGGRVALPRLRFSRLEADAIYRLTPPGRGMEAVDFQASREAAINPDLAKYRIIHFATHGLLNSQHPELSGLVFSLVDKNGQPQDGFLGLQDIYNLNLPADLVVLSACETGLGKEISGEGLVGLTRGFMYAGATRVVASLWNVSDVATSKLMAEFYRAMEKDHMPPAAALRTAQISLLKQPRWSHPYYWAAFQIQGEWK